MQRFLGAILFAGAACTAFGQSGDTQPVFNAADIHVSPKTNNRFIGMGGRGGVLRGGRFQAKNASILNLISNAYGYTPDKILGGPSWLEVDGFDVVAKAPANTSPETGKLMLQSLLRDRFKLVLHKDTRPLPAFALTAGKKAQLKEADGSEETGCRPQSAPASAGDGGNMMMMGSNGAPIQIHLGAGDMILYACRNVSMAEFAAKLEQMIDTPLGTYPVVLDETGLKGKWNFDLRYSLAGSISFGDTTERIPLAAAIEKQLGFKLEDRKVLTPVLVVESVNRKPTENPPGTAEALPPMRLPSEFEVASIKPADPNARMGMSRTSPGGTLTMENVPLGNLVRRAFNMMMNNEELVGLPPSAMRERYNITAKVSTEQSVGNLDVPTVAPLLLALLKDRFKLAYHTEERPVTTYSLVAAKPKMKPADPGSRTRCEEINPPAGTPPGSRVLQCQNTTMPYLAERLQGLTSDLAWPIADATGVQGGWDFTLTFSMLSGAVMARAGRGGAAGGVPEASDPIQGYTIFEAVEKQLGLKLERDKRPMPVIVIDHLEQKPTDN